ncbi:putative inorganic phosphate cotransporter [Cylas formicarius]|uniref:putative inorganic phosphate cotransporter n=1 Tax=Cylas formicarius TaxID=197179 RepID=UPI002958408C|nr:putative inorganic phosphate cotransporter [Cylas formicarius]
MEVNIVPKFGSRHVQAILLFFLLVNTHTTRSNLSLAIVAMTDRNATRNPDVSVYDWDNTNIILSSFGWTYMVLQLFSGYFFKKFGVKWTLFTAMLLNSIIFMLIPQAAWWLGSTGVIICTLAQGFFQGFCLPCCQSALGRWAPVSERSLLSMVAYSGTNTGNLIAMVVSGYIASSWVGWPFSFYVFGACSVLWCVIWAIFSYDSPSEHPTISPVERRYIEHSLSEQENEPKKIVHIPLKAIFTSLPFWALVVANAGNSWGDTLVQADVPTYLNKVLKFDIKLNGIVSALPQIIQLFVVVILGPISDYIVEKKFVTLTQSRKLAQILGSVIPSGLLIWLAFVAENQKTLAVCLMNISLGFLAVEQYGSLINHIDISPKYAGVLLSIENSISTVVSLSAPLFVQYFVTDLTDPTLWRYVFLIFSLVTLSTAIFFTTFGSAEVQWWNNSENNYKSRNVI